MSLARNNAQAKCNLNGAELVNTVKESDLGLLRDSFKHLHSQSGVQLSILEKERVFTKVMLTQASC